MELSKLDVGSKGVITGISFTGNMRRRLWDIGFCDGSVVECVGKSLFSDPGAYLVKGTLIAVRNSDAENISVEKSIY